MTTATRKRPYRPSQTFICSLPTCGREFTAFPSDRPGETAHCCASHAALHREEQLGHGHFTLSCGTCGKEITRPLSDLPKVGDPYCNKACWSNRKRPQP